MKWDKVRDFAAVGKVYSVVAFPAPEIMYGKGWCLGFDIASDVPTGGTPDLETKRGELRVFKTLDAAQAAARDLGFGRLIVQLHDAA